MKTGWRIRLVNAAAVAALIFTTPFAADAGKSYSSGGGRSYSSSSSRSSSSSTSRSSSSSSSRSSSGSSSRSSSGSSGSKSFSSGGGKSYSSGSTWTGTSHSYSSGKSYTGSSGNKYSSGSNNRSDMGVSKPSNNPGSGSSSFTYDTATARARKEESSKSDFTKYKESQNPRPVQRDDSYRGAAPPVITPSSRSYRRNVYVPDTVVIRTRPSRIYSVFSPYYYRPVVVYHDPYSSFFWWWLLDRSIEDQAWWAYHHRYDMDPGRYQALLANNQQLEARVQQLEAQQVQRDPTYTPTNLDRDLMYSDQYVNQSYNNRPTSSGKVAFWAFAVPTAIGCSWFFIWLIWFKRWQTAT